MSINLNESIAICISEPDTETTKKQGKRKNGQEKMQYKVERIVKKEGKGPSAKFLVKWEGYDEKDNTWEPASNLSKCRSLITEFYQARKNNLLPSISQTKTAPADKKNFAVKNPKVNQQNIIELLTKPNPQKASSKPDCELLSDLKPSKNIIATSKPQSNKAKTSSLPITIPVSKKSQKAIQPPAKQKPKISEISSDDFEEPGIAEIQNISLDETINTSTAVVQKIQSKMASKSNAPKEKSKQLKKPTASTTVVLNKEDLKIDIGKDSQSINDQKFVENSTHISGHAILKGVLYFKLESDSVHKEDNLGSRHFNYDFVDHVNPRLLTRYLKNFIKVDDK
jgi:hypothetical protein